MPKNPANKAHSYVHTVAAVSRGKRTSECCNLLGDFDECEYCYEVLYRSYSDSLRKTIKCVIGRNVPLVGIDLFVFIISAANITLVQNLHNIF
jgi:hypothetical protein